MSWTTIARRAALGISIVLLIVLAVTVVIRANEVNDSADRQLENAAQRIAIELERNASIAFAAATAADSTEAAARGLANADAEAADWCVVDRSADDPACDLGPVPDDRPAVTTIIADGRYHLVVDGPAVSIAVSGNARRVVSDELGYTVRLATSLPDGVEPNAFVDIDGRRQFIADIEGVEAYAVSEHRSGTIWAAGERELYAALLASALAFAVTAGVVYLNEQRKLVEQARLDQLTEIDNRREVERRGTAAAAQAASARHGLALMLFDLNGFKDVNDTHGHAAGDQLLREVASRLIRCTDSDDIVGRWGGDEFVVIFEVPEHGPDPFERAQRICDTVGGLVRLPGTDVAVRISLSAGLAFLPEHGRTLGNLLRAADLAMYEAKRRDERLVIANAQVANA